MKHIDNGTIIYWLDYSVYGYSIEYGIVFDHWSDKVAVDRLVFRNRTTIDGVDIHDVHFPTKPKKLPKNWSYDMRMYESGLNLTEQEEEVRHLEFTTENIQKLYDDGFLIPASAEPYWHGHIETVVEKGEWYLRYVYDSQKSATLLKDWNEIFLTKEAVQERINEINAENNRVANLSDYDYNVERLDKLLDKCKGIYHMSDDEADKIRTKIMSLDDFEDLEFRLISGGIQFKNWKKKRWIGVEV